MLASRKANPRPLTDYIGRVETVSPPLRRACKNTIKVKIQDEWLVRKNVIEITFWAQTMFPYEKENAMGQLLAVTATIVTTFQDLANWKDQKQLDKRTKFYWIDQIQRTKFTHKAIVTEITEDRKWFYVTCLKCKGKVHIQRAEIPRFVCKYDGHVPNPSFMYCVNTTIEDESDKAKAVFFNEAIEQMLEKSCYNMVVKDGHTIRKLYLQIFIRSGEKL
ncbi:putative nucleic acid-binding, replication factor A [Helianthus annuus]|nr:putative nucleic acid-binding, replication factor A [Helianthus annuus]